jgi:hypothetical protein
VASRKVLAIYFGRARADEPFAAANLGLIIGAISGEYMRKPRRGMPAKGLGRPWLEAISLSCPGEAFNRSVKLSTVNT